MKAGEKFSIRNEIDDNNTSSLREDMYPQRNLANSSVYSDDDSIGKEEISARSRTSRLSTCTTKRFLIILLVLTSAGAFVHTITHASTPRSVTCEKPHVRREWRTLSTLDKLSYIDSVKCLQNQPSKLQAGGSLYDDFPYVHRAVGYLSHEKANFLVWHRYFVHTFEKHLRNECQYRGPMPYWNWALDYRDPAASPVFDGQLGFGGNGDTTLSEGPVGGGHCVTNGPFAMTTVRYIGLEVKPHCLSRNFRNDTSMGHFTGNLIRPELVEKMMDEDELLLFTLKLESAPHNAIPAGIRGDFMSFNAPADPLFFLHHAQLDRLWWEWQQIKPERRNTYHTRRSSKSREMTKLDDIIDMGGLAPNAKVSDIIDTSQGHFCYTYDA